MPNVQNSALAGLLGRANQPAEPEPAAPPPAPEPAAEPQPAAGLTPATDEQIARHGLPPGTMQIKLSPDDPAFEGVAASAAAEGRQIVQAGGEVFAVAPPKPAPGLLADAQGAGGPTAGVGPATPPAGAQGGLLG